MNDKMFPRLFTKALRPGPYFRIIVEGDIGAGDEIRVVDQPDHNLTIRDVFRIFFSRPNIVRPSIDLSLESSIF
ncbi:hypothetical protein MJD09_20390 [bacterium]|nr:hypothetical protein [bacterium]